MAQSGRAVRAIARSEVALGDVNPTWRRGTRCSVLGRYAPTQPPHARRCVRKGVEFVE